jgi:hypothetical protein
MTLSYATEPDIIAILEQKLLQFEDQLKALEVRKMHIENELRMRIEIKAEDKASGLTNEKKRQIAYEELADCNEELQELIIEIRNFRREQKFLKIELDNEHRAFQLLLSEKHNP